VWSDRHASGTLAAYLSAFGLDAGAAATLADDARTP
jgi:hypothetical protein